MAHYRCLMIGAGGMAGNWIRNFLPRFADRLEVVGLVDVDPRALAASGDFLGLAASRRFADLDAAFDAVEADFCAIVIPPAFHQRAVMAAVRRGLPILSEKPIADTWQASREIYRAVRDAGLKMQVIQNYRYNAPMLTMRQVLRGGDLGRINYVVGRFAADYREHGAWGATFRHEMPHALLVEGAVHHFDMLRNLTGGDCRTIAGWEWNPPWSSSKGEFCGLYLMKMTNGVHASYEGSGTAGGEQNTWHEEYYRAECERGAVAVGRDHQVRTHRFKRGGGLITEEVPLVRPPYEGHLWLIDEFLTWLDGGPTPATVIDDNLKTTAMLYGAIEASRTNQTVDVEAMAREAGL
ncbi:MAG: Gfo/Idh/MocA family protein [Chloroflexota bacterium]